MLNLIGGLDQPTAGKVLLDGHDLSTFNEERLAALRRQKFGFIFQRHYFFPVLTARENVEFPMLLDNLPLSARRARCGGSYCTGWGLADKADHLPDELSGGEQQRVGIARALANSVTMLLADEPTGNLDSATAATIIDMLIEFKRAHELTLIMVTRRPEEAAYADRIFYLKDGHLVGQKGTAL